MSIRILYIDDEPDIREVAVMALSLDPNFEVRTAASGREGISIAQSWAPHIILLDVMMPDLDGPSVMATLRECPNGGDFRFLFITARTQSHEVAKLRAMGALGVIAKPFDPMTLAEQAGAFLDG